MARAARERGANRALARSANSLSRSFLVLTDAVVVGAWTTSRLFRRVRSERICAISSLKSSSSETGTGGVATTVVVEHAVSRERRTGTAISLPTHPTRGIEFFMGNRERPEEFTGDGQDL